eukprot:scaffold45365_cov61-Phaeocystis_antarctica.AAC.3
MGCMMSTLAVVARLTVITSVQPKRASPASVIASVQPRRASAASVIASVQPKRAFAASVTESLQPKRASSASVMASLQPKRTISAISAAVGVARPVPMNSSSSRLARATLMRKAKHLFG